MTDQQSERAVEGNTGDGTKTATKIVQTGESGILVPLLGGAYPEAIWNYRPIHRAT